MLAAVRSSVRSRRPTGGHDLRNTNVSCLRLSAFLTVDFLNLHPKVARGIGTALRPTWLSFIFGKGNAPQVRGIVRSCQDEYRSKIFRSKSQNETETQTPLSKPPRASDAWEYSFDEVALIRRFACLPAGALMTAVGPVSGTKFSPAESDSKFRYGRSCQGSIQKERIQETGCLTRYTNSKDYQLLHLVSKLLI